MTLMWLMSVKRPTLGVECTYIFVSSNTYLKGINKRDVIELVLSIQRNGRTIQLSLDVGRVYVVFLHQISTYHMNHMFY